MSSETNKENLTPATTDNHGSLMDEVYSWQTSIYDLTRKYYLLGRDRTLVAMAPKPDDQVLEVGCGTGRNMRFLLNRTPGLKVYGLDCSKVMLDFAAQQMEQAGLAHQAEFRETFGNTFRHKETFGLDEPFDKIVISYCLTMDPNWRDTIRNCRENLRPGGELWMTDFAPCGKLPKLAGALLIKWLGAFHVAIRYELEQFLKDEVMRTGDLLEYTEYLGGYYYVAKLTRQG